MTDNNTSEQLKPSYRIHFSECNHTMDTDLQFLIKEAKRMPDGESYYICKDCNEKKRGFCDKTPLKRAAYVTRLPQSFPSSSPSPLRPFPSLSTTQQQLQNNS